ncbi:MAG: type II secretion system protein E, partial [Phototrophicales bacterium]
MPGNGKSTTCASLISERLRRHAGICVTVEDPPEMPLHGRHGKGLCLQREVGINSTFEACVIETLRAYPTQVNSILMIGEVREPSTASLALNASIDGRLVIVTLHASSIVHSIQRICTIASENMAERAARELLSSGLRLCIHQKITNGALSY